MSTEHKISAAGRKDEGKGASRRLRHAAQIPAIVYGGHADPVSIQLEHEKTWQASQNEWFYSSILSLDVDGKVERVLLRDMQRHPYKQQIMHLDFQRVSENQALEPPSHGSILVRGSAADGSSARRSSIVSASSARLSGR